LASQAHRVVLCADDFGLTEGVSRGILELAHRGRISATSAMTNGAWWPRLAGSLSALHGAIGVGLHLTLTAGAPLGPMPRLAPNGVFPSLSDILRASFAGRLPRDEIAAEIERQLDAFEDAFGAMPDFVDGHQHVHVLPGIRGALIAALAQRSARPWLRDPTDRPAAILRRGIAVRKALFVGGLAAGFRRAAEAAGFSTNDGFSGFSPFDPRIDAARILERAFDRLGPRPVVMCHPGYVDDALRGVDPVVEPRAAELAYLASDRFAELIASRGIALVPRPP
jgi:predicted glycoside hydrolase/deacetylase ChbG (UPF0249 family)